MHAYARRTGLEPVGDRPTRYLWTDAFAVCNYLSLRKETGSEAHLALARRLVGQVHEVLGAHRGDDRREGPLSGLPAAEAAAHPTAGGLRIGKPLPERNPYEPFDARLEWERDGQYFHYLTKWMHALAQVGAVTGEPRHVRWAGELARVAHRAFTRSVGPGRMAWKMSVDLERPLVPSMGQHDPLDAWITYATLTTSPLAEGLDLRAEIEEARALCLGGSLVTDDPLGLGGLLTDALRAAQLHGRGVASMGALLGPLLEAAHVGLVAWVRSGELGRPAERRLPFRELGLAIGLEALELLRDAAPRGARSELARVAPYAPLGDELVGYWREPVRRVAHRAHLDIDEVMLATALLPERYLVLE